MPCANCTHYSKPGAWSARCELNAWDQTKTTEWNVAHGTVRADCSCAEWEPSAEHLTEFADYRASAAEAAVFEGMVA